MTLGRTTYEDDANGAYHLLNTWGGEGIYFYVEEGGELWSRLTGLGRPALVVTEFDPSPDGPLQASYPGLLTNFVGVLMGLQPQADVFYGADIAPECIHSIWQPGDAEYDRHAQLPR